MVLGELRDAGNGLRLGKAGRAAVDSEAETEVEDVEDVAGDDMWHRMSNLESILKLIRRGRYIFERQWDHPEAGEGMCSQQEGFNAELIVTVVRPFDMYARQMILQTLGSFSRHVTGRRSAKRRRRAGIRSSGSDDGGGDVVQSFPVHWTDSMIQVYAFLFSCSLGGQKVEMTDISVVLSMDVKVLTHAVRWLLREGHLRYVDGQKLEIAGERMVR